MVWSMALEHMNILLVGCLRWNEEVALASSSDCQCCWEATDMSHSEFRLFMEHLSAKYPGDTYHLIAKNCNHFTDEVCTRLTGKPIPRWVNRLARLGSSCNCLLPESIEVTAVRHLPDHPTYSDDDGSESSASFASAVTEEGEPNHHLLTSSNGDVDFKRKNLGS